MRWYLTMVSVLFPGWLVMMNFFFHILVGHLCILYWEMIFQVFRPYKKPDYLISCCCITVLSFLYFLDNNPLPITQFANTSSHLVIHPSFCSLFPLPWRCLSADEIPFLNFCLWTACTLGIIQTQTTPQTFYTKVNKHFSCFLPVVSQFGVLSLNPWYTPRWLIYLMSDGGGVRFFLPYLDLPWHHYQSFVLSWI